MTIEEINQMVESIGLPCTYYEFPEGTQQAPPYIAWFLASDNDMYADNENYADIEQLNIELYTSIRDFELEAQVEEVLRAKGFTWRKEPGEIPSEKMHQTAWEMEVFINES